MFEFFIVEEFGSTDRISSREECKISGIMKLHSLVNYNDKLIALQWTCTKCAFSIICSECKKLKPAAVPSDIKHGKNEQ